MYTVFPSFGMNRSRSVFSALILRSRSIRLRIADAVTADSSAQHMAPSTKGTTHRTILTPTVDVDTVFTFAENAAEVDAHKCHGLRIGRVSIRLASGSLTKCSFAGFHFNVRFKRPEISAIMPRYDAL